MPAGIPGEAHVMTQERSEAFMERVTVNCTPGSSASVTFMALRVWTVGSPQRMTLRPRAMAMRMMSWSCILLCRNQHCECSEHTQHACHSTSPRSFSFQSANSHAAHMRYNTGSVIHIPLVNASPFLKRGQHFTCCSRAGQLCCLAAFVDRRCPCQGSWSHVTAVGQRHMAQNTHPARNRWWSSQRPSRHHHLPACVGMSAPKFHAALAQLGRRPAPRGPPWHRNTPKT